MLHSRPAKVQLCQWIKTRRSEIKCIVFEIFRRVRKIAKKQLLASPCVSVRPLGTTRLPLDGNASSVVLEDIAFRNSVQEIQGILKSDKNTGYCTRRPMYIYDRSVFPKMRNVPDKICTENRNTHFTFNIGGFQKSCPYQIMCKYTDRQADRPEMTV